MSQFNYYLFPSVPLPSIYYINIPSMASIDPPAGETLTQINSEQIIRTNQPVNSRLDLSQE